ncbi:hexameric tyrosine-coordinated heme protein [Bradyrhizobium sp. USDA 4350]
MNWRLKYHARVSRLFSHRRKTRKELRPTYDSDAERLIAASHVVAVNFATIAAANEYWREK